MSRVEEELKNFSKDGFKSILKEGLKNIIKAIASPKQTMAAVLEDAENKKNFKNGLVMHLVVELISFVLFTLLAWAGLLLLLGLGAMLGNGWVMGALLGAVVANLSPWTGALDFVMGVCMSVVGGLALVYVSVWLAENIFEKKAGQEKRVQLFNAMALVVLPWSLFLFIPGPGTLVTGLATLALTFRLHLKIFEHQRFITAVGHGVLSLIVGGLVGGMVAAMLTLVLEPIKNFDPLSGVIDSATSGLYSSGSTSNPYEALGRQMYEELSKDEGVQQEYEALLRDEGAPQEYEAPYEAEAIAKPTRETFEPRPPKVLRQSSSRKAVPRTRPQTRRAPAAVRQKKIPSRPRPTLVPTVDKAKQQKAEAEAAAEALGDMFGD